MTTRVKVWSSLIAVGVLVAVFLLGRPQAVRESGASLGAVSSVVTVLAAEESDFDFGSISMAAGLVRHSYRVRNMSDAPVMITRMYTSCMCTNASFIRGSERRGPFGMPGHGMVPTLRESIAPGEEVTIEAVFDPAAHGPAGVGQVNRSIYLENDAGEPLEIGFTALVTP